MTAMRQDPPHGLAAPGASGGRRGTLSIIVPAKNEAASLPQLVEETARAFRPLTARAGGPHPLEAFELLIVDDGSTDESPAVLRELAGRYPELRPIRLAVNAGQSAATLAGFRAARGDWVAILDADLQNPPAELARLWDALPGYDAALGWRANRQDVRWKKILSRWANRVRNALLGGEPIRDTGCAVRIFPRDVATRFPMFHGAHRFYGSLLGREGCRIVQLPVDHRARPHGRSHYNFWNRSLNVVMDLLGMAWLLRRPVRYQAVELVEGGLPARPHAAVGAEGASARPMVRQGGTP